MNAMQIMLGVSNLVVGLLAVALAIPLLMGKMPRNAWYGVRFSQSLASDRAWLAINRYGARRLVHWSIAMVLLGGVTFLLPLDDHPWAFVPLALAPLTVLVPAAQSYRFARQYAAERNRPRHRHRHRRRRSRTIPMRRVVQRAAFCWVCFVAFLCVEFPDPEDPAQREVNEYRQLRDYERHHQNNACVQEWRQRVVGVHAPQYR